MVKETDWLYGPVGGIVVKHIFRMGESLSFGEAVNRMARALKRTGSPAAEVANGRTLWSADQETRQTGERRLSQRRAYRGRRRADGVGAVDETPRVLLIEPDLGTRLLYACLFEEAGYAVYAVAESTGALDVARGRLPDVVVMRVAGPPGADEVILRQWGEDPLISSIPIVVIASLLRFDVPVRAPGAISVLGKPTGPESVLAEVDKLISVTPRERLVVRQLRRSLSMLRELGQRVKPDERAQERVRSLIDRLQVAILALDTDGHYVAVSRGASTLTGYARAELIGKSIFDTGLALNPRVSEGWQQFLDRKESVAKTILPDRGGNVVSIQTEFATILPGLHAAALAG
jgi:PAS domain-containing protein